MAKRTKDLPRQVAIRMDDELVRMLAQDAERNGRTVAQSARFILRQTLNAQPVDGVDEPDDG